MVIACITALFSCLWVVVREGHMALEYVVGLPPHLTVLLSEVLRAHGLFRVIKRSVFALFPD